MSTSAPYAVRYCIQIAAACSQESDAGCFTTAVAGTKATSPYTVGMDLSSSFKGSMETDSKMRKMFSEDIKSRQLFSGKFNLEKIIKFHENATEAQPKIGCGIDC